jgi:hypothetical protein
MKQNNCTDYANKTNTAILSGKIMNDYFLGAGCIGAGALGIALVAAFSTLMD